MVRSSAGRESTGVLRRGFGVETAVTSIGRLGREPALIPRTGRSHTSMEAVRARSRFGNVG